MKKVFIYGTLRTGGRLHGWMHIVELGPNAIKSRFIANAVLYGAKLYDLGGDVPGIHPGEGHVIGELWEVSDNHFERLKYLESGYVDTPYQVECSDGSTQECITFVWPSLDKGYGTDKIQGEIESGDWMER